MKKMKKGKRNHNNNFFLWLPRTGGVTKYEMVPTPVEEPDPYRIPEQTAIV